MALLLAALTSVTTGCVNTPGLSEPFDIVLLGGQVIDPETGLNAVRNVGVRGDRIAAVTTEPIDGEVTIDVSDQVVSPGFIDLHNHSPTPLGFRYQAFDGVTTTLELEAGALPIEKFGSMLRDGALLNYGASASHVSARAKVRMGIEYVHFLDTAAVIPIGTDAFSTPLSASERDELAAVLHDGLDQGGLGIGLLLDYISDAVDSDEMRTIFEVAGERGAPVFVHIRRGLAGDPAGLIEVIDLARATGAPVHVCHLQHSAMKGTNDFLAMIDAARADGIDITTEVLPYPAGTTSINAAVFHRDWQAIFDISYEDVEWAATGERFNAEMWAEYQQKYPNGLVIHHYVKEPWIRAVIEHPDVIVVTDSVPAITESVGVAPQGIGSFAKVLARYVRDEQLIDLPTGLAKMTLLPARRLESIAPVFKRKGRLQVGMDADITVFDPATIQDNATYREPFQRSTGVSTVLVNGKIILRDGELIEGVFPGRRLTGRLQ